MTARVGHLLQTNLNHCAGAQELLMQSMAEWSIELAVIAEPYKVPDCPNWISNEEKSVAIARGEQENSPPVRALERAQDFIAAKWGKLVVIGVYAPPSLTLEDFERLMDSLRDTVARYLPQQMLIMGDFNAKSTQWGSTKINAKGRAMEDWAAGLDSDLRLLNSGNVSTCVRWQGEYIVDLTWASPTAVREVVRWKVLEDKETLSDHRYIAIDFHNRGRRNGRCETSRPSEQGGRKPLTEKRWALKKKKKMDADIVGAAALTAIWLEPPLGQTNSIERETEWLHRTMESICDASMPRVRRQTRDAVYWWSDDLEEQRAACLRA